MAKPKNKSTSDNEGQRIWGPLWNSKNLRNWAWNAGLASEAQPQEVKTARGRRRRARNNK